MIRIRKILCPVDFHPPSEAAISYAIWLAQHNEAKLHIVHVIPPVMTVPGRDTGEIVKSAHDESRMRLARMVNTAKGSGIAASAEVRFGEIDREILKAVDEQKANLVVAATHGRRGFQHWLMGSVCERLVRMVPVPILTVGDVRKAAGQPNIKRMLIAVDFSEGSADVVSHALSIAQECLANVMLLHVADFTTGDVAQGYQQSVMQGMRREMEKLVSDDARRWCDIATRVEFGIPYRVILRVAEQGNTDMIVLGTHGKSMLERTLLGSNAERIIRGARVPVLAIPPKLQKKVRETAASTAMETRR